MDYDLSQEELQDVQYEEDRLEVEGNENDVQYEDESSSNDSSRRSSKDVLNDNVDPVGMKNKRSERAARIRSAQRAAMTLDERKLIRAKKMLLFARCLLELINNS